MPPPKIVKKDAAADRESNLDFKLAQLDSELERLHSLYEQHFAGLIKLEPQREFKVFKQQFHAIGAGDLKTTAQKFRHQGLQAKIVQYTSLWTKTQRQIEEGTYKRDLFLLNRKQANPTKKAEPPAKGAPSQRASKFDALYEKLKGLSKDPQKLPARDAFIKTIEKQIDAQKQKNPGRKIEVKLAKDEKGNIQVKLALKPN